MMSKVDRGAIAETLVMTAVKLPRVLRALDETPRLTSTEASALAVLVHGGPMNIGSLARFEQVRAPSMTRTISNLEDRRLVERTPDPSDARGWIVQVTPQGKKLFVQGHERKIAPLRRWLDDLSRDDFQKLVRALPVIQAMGELTKPRDG
jgi:DNA-binding MarR family transcriptional regulator